MKKITLLIAFAIFTQLAFSQVVGLRGGASLIDGSNFFGPGATFQYGINENIVVGLNLDYHLGESSSSLLNVEPRVDYYLKSAFDGLHLGTNFSYLRTSFGSASVGEFALGGSLGYSHPINENLIIDLSSGGAYLMDSKVLAIRPILTLAYKLGK